MNNSYWKNKALKKTALKAYEKQNIKRFESIISDGNDIVDLLGFDDLLIECIKDQKMYLFKYFLIRLNITTADIRKIHIYLKENNLKKEEKVFILYTGQKDTKKSFLINAYKRVSKKLKYTYSV